MSISKRKLRTVVYVVLLIVVLALGALALVLFHPNTRAGYYLAQGDYYLNTGVKADGTYDAQVSYDYYLKAVKANPKASNYVWHRLANLAYMQGDYDKATQYLNSHIEHFGPDDPIDTHYALGVVYATKARMKEDSEARQQAEYHFRQFLERAPNDPLGVSDLAKLYYLEDNYEEMGKLLQEAIAVSPNNPWLLNMYGLALSHSGDMEGAKIMLTLALEELQKFSSEDWGRVYPGTNPAEWSLERANFIEAVQGNLNEVTTMAEIGEVYNTAQ